MSTQTSTNKGIDRTVARHPRRLGGDPIANAKSVVSLSGMILNNADDQVQHLAPKKKPDWLRAKLPGGAGFKKTRDNVHKHKLQQRQQD